MIERHIRQFLPVPDTSRIASIRLSNEPEIREAIFWEYGIAELLPFAVDTKLIDAEINDFLRLRGTLTAIRMAMCWIGFERITFVRLSATEYEIDPGRVPGERDITAMRAALSVSAQARGTLKRIFHGSYEVKFG